jgi:ligand-binding sensor domain-containing protein
LLGYKENQFRLNYDKENRFLLKQFRINIISFILLFTTLCAQNNNAIFDHITIEDGLSHSLINSITQDSIGFIWIATQEGLNRFDGYKIKTFKKEEHEGKFLDDWITTVNTDSKGNVWYGTRAKGLGKYTPSDNEFINYEKLLLDNYGTLACKIQDILIDTDTTIWIGTWGGGLIKFNPQTLQMTQYLHDPNNEFSISENRIYKVFKDTKGFLWIGTHRSGLNQFDVSTNKFYNYRAEEGFVNGLRNNFVVTIEQDYRGKLWIGTYGGGAYCFDEEKKYFDKLCAKTKIQDSLITKIFEDSDSTLWICTDGGGIYKYSNKDDKFRNIRNISSNRRSLNDNRIWSVIEDNSGILWFGTFSGGLNIYNKKKNIFEHLFHVEDNPQTISNNFVKKIFEDSRKNIWVGTNNGISILDRNQKIIRHLSKDNGLPHNRIRKIIEDKSGIIWLATWGGGLISYNPTTKIFSNYRSDSGEPNSIADNFLKALVEHPNGKIFIGTELGLNEFNKETGAFKLYQHDENDSTSLSNPQVSVLFVDSKERFWVGTQYGLNIFDMDSGKFKRFRADGTNKGISNYRVSEIYEDKKGRIWIGTYGGGLNLYNDEDETFKTISVKDGLSNNSIYEMLEDDEEYYWVSTNRGLTRFNLEKDEFRIFTKQDGLQENEFNGGAALKTEDGKFYFGGVNGITVFHPENVKMNERIPKIVLTELKVNDEQLPVNEFLLKDEVYEFNYKENFLDFEFAALDYTSPKLNRFQFKLIGLDDYWHDPEFDRGISFTNLDPGDYTLHVKASNSDDVWNEEGIKFNFIITPPWWATTSFRIIAIVLILIILQLLGL